MDKTKKWMSAGACLFLAFICLIGANVGNSSLWVIFGFLLLIGGAFFAQWARMDG